MHPARIAARIVGATYVLVTAISCVVRHNAAPAPPPEGPWVEVHAVEGDREIDRRVRVAYQDAGPAGAPAVVLLHGSPGSRRDFQTVVPRLAETYRLIVPDLPGFGDSERDVPDYSIRANARYVLEMLDELGIEDVDVVGFSMGGGVGLSMADLAPGRVRSITLLSSIGVQEMELLGDYALNHAVHGALLTALWGFHELTPHFGALDDVILSVPYARSFYDSDQRPLRGILMRWPGPMLIVHGREDPLVPVQAAREHARLVPQSELVVTEESHFIVFRSGPKLAETIGAFLARVDRGRALTRGRAAPVRVAAAAAQLDPRALPKLSGLPWLLVLGLVALATFMSEDLTCVGAGLLVATGRLDFVPVTVACLVGIVFGDLNAYFAGRIFGRAVLARAPMKWIVTDKQVQRASAWFRERGPVVILASRFLPGTRVATFIAAGVLHTPFLTFLLWFGLAALLWTPLLVGVSALIGTPILGAFRRFQLWALPAAVLTAVLALVVTRVVPKLFSWRGRRLLASRLRRAVRWEYWPPFLFYGPVALYVVWEGIRHRSLTLFTAANPAIDAGGFINESKSAILSGLVSAGDVVAPWRLLRVADPLAARLEAVRSFDLPVVLKPDAGQRGSGVAVLRTRESVEAYLAEAQYDVVAQAYVPGVEYGVFYVRRPEEATGRIFAITEKRMPEVVGDGRRTLEELILDDRRARPMAHTYFENHRARLSAVVPQGERVQLAELGTHALGAYFHDGAAQLTPELSDAIERVSRSFDGFFFGRYDVRSATPADFRRGVFRVIELNGVTSEATSIYDPSNSLLDAYRTLFAQWRLAFEIGAANRDRGFRPASISDLARAIVRYRHTADGHL